MISSAPQPAQTANTPLHVSDLKAAAGAFDAYDAMILALCDNSFVTDDITAGSERFCHQLRNTTNADTVYLCCRHRLTVTATTSAANDVNNDDTQAIHNTLREMIADLGTCERPVKSPGLSVFPDQGKMDVSIVPVSQQSLAIIVDADEPYKELNQYCADAITALYQCHTAPEYEGFAPTIKQMEKYVLDALNRLYSPVSTLLETRRFDLFTDDLNQLDVRFEKLIEPQPSGNPVHWGYAVVAEHPTRKGVADQLLDIALERSVTYQCAVDICVLKKAAYQYKALSESASVQHMSDVKPLCVGVSLQSLQQRAYADTLDELIERCVIAGSHLVFEVRDTPATASTPNNRQATLQQIVNCLHQLRVESGIRVMLSERALKHASLTTLLALEPEFLRFNQFISKAGVQPVGAMLEEFSLLAASGVAAGNKSMTGTAFVSDKVSPADTPRETKNEAVPH
jgi:hypothetical protein